MRFIMAIVAFIAGVLMAASAGTMASTHFVLAALIELGAEIPFSVRMETIFHDLNGMGPLYAGLIAVGYLVAFPTAGLISRWLAPARTLVYMASGAFSIHAILWSIKNLYLDGANPLFGLNPISGAREPEGYIAQLVAGAIGGLVFALIKRPR